MNLLIARKRPPNYDYLSHLVGIDHSLALTSGSEASGKDMDKIDCIKPKLTTKSRNCLHDFGKLCWVHQIICVRRWLKLHIQKKESILVLPLSETYKCIVYIYIFIKLDWCSKHIWAPYCVDREYKIYHCTFEHLNHSDICNHRLKYVGSAKMNYVKSYFAIRNVFEQLVVLYSLCKNTEYISNVLYVSDRGKTKLLSFFGICNLSPRLRQMI